MCRWTFWYVYTLSHNEKKKQGRKGRHHEYILHEVYSFDTIEDFWKMYNNIYSVEEIMPNTDYMLFRKGIRPEWEDPANRAGGKWVVTLPIEEDMEEEVVSHGGGYRHYWDSGIGHCFGGWLVGDRCGPIVFNSGAYGAQLDYFKIDRPRENIRLVGCGIVCGDS